MKLQSYFLIFESKVKFDETQMKKSKHENSVLPYSLHSTINLPPGDRKTQMSL